ncbi:MAG: FlgD immunoglobulin-like domain containing protein [Patescibacteria group bacterium]
MPQNTKNVIQIVVGILVVAVIGAAVYLGSSKSQKGALRPIPILPRVSSISHSANPATFYPQAGESVTIKYEVLSRVSSLRLDVMDRYGAVVAASLVESKNLPVEPGNYTVQWNGKNAAGRTYGAGQYTYSFFVGSQTNSFLTGKIAIASLLTHSVDTNAISLSSPNSVATIRYWFNTDFSGGYILRIVDRQGRIVKNLNSATTSLPANESIYATWNGRNASSTPVSPGMYTYEFVTNAGTTIGSGIIGVAS